MAVRRKPTEGADGEVLTTTEARQGTGPRAMLWVLLVSISLAVIVGLMLGAGWIALPWTGGGP